MTKEDQIIAIIAIWTRTSPETVRAVIKSKGKKKPPTK
jgi:hypothetical protein